MYRLLLRWALLIMIPVLLLSGCSISMSFKGASIPENLQTFSVKYFENRAPLINPQLSQIMTEKLKDRLTNESRLRLVTDMGDVDFSGTIRRYNTRPMAIQADAESAETRLTIEVEVKYRNFKNPKENWESTFSAYEDFESDRSITEVEDELVDLIVDQLTENIFNKAFANW